ncbi:hypothetical protein BGZ60DRAFT_23090 [Tricladium varicosporioides]|nr:hypothetical protein BGZ60DRAFT_23090 [Hymenoscyphus varicosporioides]
MGKEEEMSRVVWLLSIGALGWRTVFTAWFSCLSYRFLFVFCLRVTNRNGWMRKDEMRGCVFQRCIMMKKVLLLSSFIPINYAYACFPSTTSRSRSISRPSILCACVHSNQRMQDDSL